MRAERFDCCGIGFNDKGLSLHSLFKYEEAQSTFERARELFMQLNNESMAGNSYSALALLYYQTGSYVKAVKSANEAIRIFQKHNYPNFMTSPLNVLGNIAKKQGDYGNARIYYKESLSYRRKGK